MASVVALCRSRALTALELLGIPVHVVEGGAEALKGLAGGDVLLVEEPLLPEVEKALRELGRRPFIVVLPSPEKGSTGLAEEFARRVLGALGVVS